jgi:hypothetical protein
LPIAANVKELLTPARPADVNAVAEVPLFEAVSCLEFRVAMHNIRELGIRRLLEGFPRGVMK